MWIAIYGQWQQRMVPTITTAAKAGGQWRCDWERSSVVVGTCPSSQSAWFIGRPQQPLTTIPFTGRHPLTQRTITAAQMATLTNVGAGINGVNWIARLSKWKNEVHAKLTALCRDASPRVCGYLYALLVTYSKVVVVSVAGDGADDVTTIPTAYWSAFSWCWLRCYHLINTRPALPSGKLTRKWGAGMLSTDSHSNQQQQIVG